MMISIGCFFGDSSYDPDAEDFSRQIQGYVWTILEWPEDSEKSLKAFGEGNARTVFDVAGTYRFQLEVRDMEGLICEEPFLVTVNVE